MTTGRHRQRTDRPRYELVLDELEALLTSGESIARGAETVIAEARAHADEVGGVALEDPADVQLGAMTFLADVVVTLALERVWKQDELDRLVDQCAPLVGLSERATRLAVCLRALRDPGLLQLPPMLALETQLQLAVSLSPAAGMSVWLAQPTEQPRSAASFGAGQSGRTAIAEVRRALCGGAPRQRAHLRAVPIRRWQAPIGALLVRALPKDQPFALAVAHELTAAMGSILEKDALLHRAPGGLSAIAEAAERRLARFRLDLHDGVLQDFAVLADEVRYFHRQVENSMAENVRLQWLLGRIDDVEAGVAALDSNLRDAIRSLEADGIAGEPLRKTLEHEFTRLRGRGIEVSFRSVGRLGPLTDSQRIAIVRVAQEALANVARHSGATSAEVSLIAKRSHVRIEISDNGRGFDVEPTLVEAARRGRLGVVGMNERVRLLGGTFEVESRTGGPTRIAVVLPAWHPIAEASVEDVPSTGTGERS